jgi:hypothetical protein
MTTRRVFVIVFLLAVALRIGYGVAGYRHVLGATGANFIALWDYDAIEHVLIAKAIMEGKGYIVDSDADLTNKHVRIIGGPALFKAPLYQYLLAAIFSISGFSFALFFPIQALMGGGLSILVSAIALRAFKSPQSGLFAGLAAAAHPTLLNTASQPYNENVFFFLFFLCVWTFLWWMASPSGGRAIAFGVLAALTTLTRESAILPFVAMVVFAVLYQWRARGIAAVRSGAVMVAAAVLTIAPWTLHNYRQFGVILPVSSITGTSIGIGNNECVAVGGLFVPYDGDIGCPSLDARRTALLQEMPKYPLTVWNGRAYGILGREYVFQHPIDYLRLSFRRAWTTFLPIHPRQGLVGIKEFMVIGYFVLVVAMGLAFLVISALRGLKPEAKVLLWVAVASYVPLVAIYVSADVRYRIGIDLILGCFAAYGYALLAARGLALASLPSTSGRPRV